MKRLGKLGLCLVCIFSLLFMAAYSPSISLAAKADKKAAAAKTDPADKWAGKVNASFDINKMGNMSDFDPANPIVPTGDVIKIAHVSTFSGPGAINGEFHFAGLAWAVHDINKRGGIMVDGKKKRIALIKADTMGKPDQAKKVCERMILQEKVHFLVGTTGSNIMKVMNEVGNKYKIPVMNEGALSDELMDATNFGPYAFNTSATASQIGRGLAYYYGQVKKKEKKFFILCQDYSFGRSLADGFKAGLKEYYPDAQLVGEDYHKINLTDFAPYLEKIKASGAEAVFTGDFIPDAANLLKQARQLGILIPFAGLFMNDPNSLHELGVELTKGIVNIDMHDVYPAFKYPGYDKFHNAWVKQWKTWTTSPFNTRLFEHGSTNLGFYTQQMYWLLSVIERAKSTDPEKIIKVWENDTYRFANGKVIKMRACDHKAMMDFMVTEYVGWEEQKSSFNIPPYYWFKGCAFNGPGVTIPAEKVMPWMDPKLDRCAGQK